MTREECAQAVLIGVDAARSLPSGATRCSGPERWASATAGGGHADGCVHRRIAGEGGRPGTGVDDAAWLTRRTSCAGRFEVNDVGSLDALGVLAAVGGLEIAMLAGVIVGCAQERTCVVADGYISGAAALAAVALCPTRGSTFSRRICRRNRVMRWCFERWPSNRSSTSTCDWGRGPALHSPWDHRRCVSHDRGHGHVL